MLRRLIKLYQGTFTSIPLEDKQRRLQLGGTAWTMGVEWTHKELHKINVFGITPFHIEQCQKEYEEWLKSPECAALSKDHQDWERRQELTKFEGMNMTFTKDVKINF